MPEPSLLTVWPLVAVEEIEQIRQDLGHIRFRLSHIGRKWTALREGMAAAEGGLTCVITELYGEAERLREAQRAEAAADKSTKDG